MLNSVQVEIIKVLNSVEVEMIKVLNSVQDKLIDILRHMVGNNSAEEIDSTLWKVNR